MGKNTMYGQMVEDGVLDLTDDFDEISRENIEPEPGKYTAKLVSYEFIPERIAGNYYQGKFEASIDENGEEIKLTKHYELEFKAKDGTRIRKNIYPNGVAMFQKNIKYQSKGETAGMICSQIYKYLTEHEIDIWVTHSNEYGLQANFYDVEEYLEKKAARQGVKPKAADRPTENKAIRKEKKTA